MNELTERIEIRVMPVMKQAIEQVMEDKHGWYESQGQFIRECIQYALNQKYNVGFVIKENERGVEEWTIIKREKD